MCTFVLPHFLSFTFGYLQNTFISWLASRWRTFEKENEATTSKNPSHWKLQEEEMGQCPINTVKSHLFRLFLHPLIHSLKALSHFLERVSRFLNFSTVLKCPNTSRKFWQRWIKRCFPSPPRAKYKLILIHVMSRSSNDAPFPWATKH